MQSRLLTRFVDILKGAQDIQIKHLDALRTHLTDTEAALNAVSPQADQELFIDYNIAPFTPPPDWSFEPSPIHYDHVGGVYVLREVATERSLGRYERGTYA